MFRVLAVDDSASIRHLMQFALQAAGFEVVLAQDGAAALDLAQQQQFDLVVADVRMPNLDGIALLKALRADARYRATPVLMVTTEASVDRKQDGRNAGASGWIVKPFDRDQLIAAIRQLLKVGSAAPITGVETL